MFVVNEDNSIYLNRGDILAYSVTAEDNGTPYKFQAGDVLTMKVYGKKDATNVVLSKDFPVENTAERFWLFLSGDETKIGEVISKPKDYWYEVVLNEKTNPQTIIGYFDEGPVLFKLFPEGADIPETEVKPEDIPVVDSELDMTSNRPVENRAIARAFENLREGYEAVFDAVADINVTPEMFGAIGDGEADDTEAVQNALDEACSNGRTLYIPGRYRVTDTLYLRATVNMYGDGQSTQNTSKSCIRFDVGDNDIPLFQEAEGVTQVGRCTFTNVSFMRIRTEADGYNKETSPYAYGRSGICIGFNSNETSFHRCTFVGFGTVCNNVHITDFIDCDIVYCDSILSNTALCNSVNFYGGNVYACGTLIKANGNISTMNFSNCWIEDFVTLLETKGTSILGLNFTGCTLTNTANGADMIVYTATPSFAREFINFADSLVYIKGQICTDQPKNIEFGLTFDRCTVYYGGTGETIKIYGNSKFLTLSGANADTISTNIGFDTTKCTAHSPINLALKEQDKPWQLSKPANYIETKDNDMNRMLMLPVYYEFATPSVARYFMFNTNAVSVGDWVLKYVYKADSGTIEKIIVSL